MHWLHELDVWLLRFINQTLSNPVFDVLMPLASGRGAWPFFAAVAIAGLILLWKGGIRARLCVLLLILIVWPGDSFICNTVKNAVARPRPFLVFEDLNLLVGRGRSFAMPSSHAANMFAATMILFVYYRRTLWFMLPLACVVGLSRIYNGVHYPSDVLAGAILGAGYAAAGMWALNAFWQWAGRKWFPLWWAKVPSLLNPPAKPLEPELETQKPKPETLHSVDRHWIRLGYLLIAVLLVGRWLYLGSGTIELLEDEAFQWTWSKHLALSYYSKPPMIAYTQWLGTHLWGDNEFGVRFFSPVLAALTSLLTLRFMSRFVSGRATFVLLLVASTTPLLGLGATVMTIDPLSVFFWMLAMVSGWRAVQPESTTRDWFWVGLWMGLGFLSKYTALFQLLCWAVFFVLWKPARTHLRRPGPWLALAANLLCALPVILWNWQHGWATVSHVSHNAKIDKPWDPQFLQFMGQELALLNPVYFIATIWAAIAFWRPLRGNKPALYLFSMGAPLFLSYALWSFRSPLKPNWIAPSVLPLFCLMILYWHHRWNDVHRWAGKFLKAGLAFGVVMIALMHDTNLIEKIAGRPLPPKPDPLTRVRGWKESARIINAARLRLQAETGKPAFIIGGHYGTCGLLSFYLPEGRTNIVSNPLVFYFTTAQPENQFHFWPGYHATRKGQNAIFVQELNAPPPVRGWLLKWLKGEKVPLRYQPKNRPPPPVLLEEFESVTDLGQVNARYQGRVFHTFQIFECRNLR